MMETEVRGPRDKGLGRQDKKLRSPELGLVSELELEGSARGKGQKLRRLKPNPGMRTGLL